MQFLALQGGGLTVEMIAEQCFVSPKTVETTLKIARDRLQVKSTLQAVVRAIALELLALDADGNVSVPESFNYLYDPEGTKYRLAA